MSLGQTTLITLLYAFVDGDHVLALYLNYVTNASFELNLLPLLSIELDL